MFVVPSTFYIPFFNSFFFKVRRCQEIVQEGQQHLYPNGVGSMTIFEKHPILLSIAGYAVGGILPGPWQDRRQCCNDGRPEAFNNVLQFIWLEVWSTIEPYGHRYSYEQAANTSNKLLDSLW
jgi:hypothetical protein